MFRADRIEGVRGIEQGRGFCRQGGRSLCYVSPGERFARLRADGPYSCDCNSRIVSVRYAYLLGARVVRNCVVGANAVVTRDIPDFCVAEGIPARVIRRFENGEWISC